MPSATAVPQAGRVLPADRAACHCAILRRTARRITQLYDEALAPAGIRVTQYSLLASVERAGSIALTPLAEVLGMDRTTLTRNLAPLVTHKFVKLENAKGRTKVVLLTARGAALLRKAYPFWLSAQRRFAQRLGANGTASLDALARVAGR